MDEHLSPCPDPFDEVAVRHQPHLRRTGSEWLVICSCGLKGPQQPTREGAVAAWSRRSPPARTGFSGNQILSAVMKGAKWWEFASTGATMWQADQQRVAEMALRYLDRLVPDFPAAGTPENAQKPCVNEDGGLEKSLEDLAEA